MIPDPLSGEPDFRAPRPPSPAPSLLPDQAAASPRSPKGAVHSAGPTDCGDQRLDASGPAANILALS
jgi:hypothetical protein